MDGLITGKISYLQQHVVLKDLFLVVKVPCGGLGSTVGVLGVLWGSWEYCGGLGSTSGVLGALRGSWEHYGGLGSATGVLGALTRVLGNAMGSFMGLTERPDGTF